MGKYHADINEVMPTAAQRQASEKRAWNDAYAHLETALNSLDDAQSDFAWLDDKDRYRDCATIIAMAEDLKDSMDGFDSAA